MCFHKEVGTYSQENVSGLVPGQYIPTQSLKSKELVTVFAGDEAVYITGFKGGLTSLAKASELCSSTTFKQAVEGAGYDGDLIVKAVSGGSIQFPSTCSAVVKAGSGPHAENTGDLVAINLTNKNNLAMWSCIHLDLIKIHSL